METAEKLTQSTIDQLTRQLDRDYPAFESSALLSNHSPFVDRAEWMDQALISKFVKEVLEQRKR